MLLKRDYIMMRFLSLINVSFIGSGQAYDAIFQEGDSILKYFANLLLRKDLVSGKIDVKVHNELLSKLEPHHWWVMRGDSS